MDYENVQQLKMGFGYLPAKCHAEIKVEDIKALGEISTELVNPIIHTGEGALVVNGRIASNQYLEYKGGDTATVYDKNWNRLKELPVERRNDIMPHDWSTVTVTTSQNNPLPWLEVQFMTEGDPMVVPIKPLPH